MSGCGECGCNCIVANQNGVPYTVGADRYGNEAIIVPDPDSRCGMFEFVHGTTDCTDALYPFVAPVDGMSLNGGYLVLSILDDAGVTVSLRVNGIEETQLTIPAGSRLLEWPVTDFPIALNKGDLVETSILFAGNNKPTVSLQLIVCVPGDAAGETGTPPAFSEEIVALLWDPDGRGTLGAEQDPADLGIGATAPSLAYYRGSGSNPDSLWLVAADSSRALGHRRIWPPDPSQVPTHVVGWDSGAVGVLLPGNPVDVASTAIAVDRATSRITHRWDVSLGGWRALSSGQSRVELGQAGPHEPPAGPIGFTFFRNAGVFSVEVVGVWDLHGGDGLTIEVVDGNEDVKATVTIPPGARSHVPSSPTQISVPAGGALGIRVANTPSSPGEGVTLVGYFSGGI